ncbi:MAG: hypothetical protein ACKVS6_01790 [Planctomycetota bacterium]
MSSNPNQHPDHAQAGTAVRRPPCLIPSPHGVANLLSGLVGKPVSVKTAAPVSIRTKSPVAVAIYARDDHSVAAVCIFDITLANAAGAALTTIPSNVSDLSAKAGKLDDVILENFKEVLNVISQLFKTSDSQRIAFYSMHLAPPEKIPGFAAIAIQSPVARADLNIAFPGYSPGKVTIVVR